MADRVMKIALVLLTIDNAHYAPVFAASSYGLAPATLGVVKLGNDQAAAKLIQQSGLA